MERNITLYKRYIESLLGDNHSKELKAEIAWVCYHAEYHEWQMIDLCKTFKPE